MRRRPLDGEDLETSESEDRDEEFPVDIAGRPIGNLVLYRRKKKGTIKLVRAALMLCLACMVYYLGMVVHFQYSLGKHVERREYDQAISDIDKISRLPFMRHWTLMVRLQLLSDAEKWQQLKKQVDQEAAHGWLSQSPDVWYLKGMAEYMLDMRTECEQSFLYSNYLAERTRTKLMLYLLNKPKSPVHRELEFL